VASIEGLKVEEFLIQQIRLLQDENVIYGELTIQKCESGNCLQSTKSLRHKEKFKNLYG
jgi:hypothetical protein